ncbi:MAG: ribose 5-phosphate isomerase B [Desulfobacterales bacterium]
MTDNSSSIVIGSDHGAFQLKEKVKAFLGERGLVVEDFGVPSEAPVDYADIGVKVAGAVSAGTYGRGILMCGTGLGMSMIANRFPRVRAALCNDLFSVIMSRQHNDANILVIGGRVTGDVLAFEMVKVWLETPFDGGRHQARIDKLDGVDIGKFWG